MTVQDSRCGALTNLMFCRPNLKSFFSPLCVFPTFPKVFKFTVNSTGETIYNLHGPLEFCWVFPDPSLFSRNSFPNRGNSRSRLAKASCSDSSLSVTTIPLPRQLKAIPHPCPIGIGLEWKSVTPSREGSRSARVDAGALG